jgi:hypothetical protein
VPVMCVGGNKLSLGVVAGCRGVLEADADAESCSTGIGEGGTSTVSASERGLDTVFVILPRARRGGMTIRGESAAAAALVTRIPSGVMTAAVSFGLRRAGACVTYMQGRECSGTRYFRVWKMHAKKKIERARFSRLWSLLSCKMKDGACVSCRCVSHAQKAERLVCLCSRSPSETDRNMPQFQDRNMGAVHVNLTTRHSPDAYLGTQRQER